MRNLLLALFLCVLTGCSTLMDMGKGLITDDKGLEVDTELVVGDKDELNEVQVGIKSRQDAETINNINEVPIIFMLLMVLGWLLPSPSEIWRGFTRLLPWVRK